MPTKFSENTLNWFKKTQKLVKCPQVSDTPPQIKKKQSIQSVQNFPVPGRSDLVSKFSLPGPGDFNYWFWYLSNLYEKIWR